MTYLLDINVLSELVAKRRSQFVIDWIASLNSGEAYVSVMTIGELKLGVARLVESKRKRLLTNWIESDLLAAYSDNILPIDLVVVNAWADMTANLLKIGRSLQLSDSLIAATASVYNLTVATRNVKDFLQTGVKTVNPWETK